MAVMDRANKIQDDYCYIVKDIQLSGLKRI